MMGDLASRAASREATTVEEEVTLMAGMANFFSWAYLKRARTSSPTMTPDLRERTDWAIVGGCVVDIGVSKGIAVVESNETEQWWEYECERARVVGGGGSSFVMCPTTAPASLTQLSPPIDETPPCARAHANWRCPKLLVGGFRRCSTDWPRLWACDYRVASGLAGLARSSVNRRRSEDIHILQHLLLRE